MPRMRCHAVDPLARPERRQQAPSALEKAWHWARAHAPTGNGSLDGWLRWVVIPLIHSESRRYPSLSRRQINDRREALKQRLIRHGLRWDLCLKSFALVREVARREMGMAHHDVQLMGGWVMLGGHIAEMQTGEGKTLTATLPAATAALAGIPVHVITANDYLAARDAQNMAPLYRALGLRVGAITQDMSHDARRQVYGMDVVYCTNKVVVFDYLRDSRVLQGRRHPLQAHAARLRGEPDLDGLLLRGLHFAIVDEADSVMLDEARTPLILSGKHSMESLDIPLLEEALELGGRFREGQDFLRKDGRLHMTEQGRERLRAQAGDLIRSQGSASEWIGRSRREWLLHQALLAHFHFQRDRHYLVRDGRVQIIDENTGRVMPDRSWEKGLQQMIERLEGCEPSKPNVTLAQLTYQRFLRRYLHLAGMTGTAWQVRGEVWFIYRLRVVRVPPHQPVRRRWMGTVRLSSMTEKWDWVARRAALLSEQGRAVLITTVSVGELEQLSAVLSGLGVPHNVLSARQDSQEAQVIAQAGQSGRVTVATSMAGRGTDIKLDPYVRDRGGLHVIIAGHHDAARIDRQIAGRCARQGDPGSVEYVVCEQDPLLTELEGWSRRVGGLSSRLRRAQRHRERRHARERARLLDADWREADILGFSGKGD